MIVFVGDFIRRGDDWFRVVDTDAWMKVKLDNGMWIYADEGDIDELLYEAEYIEQYGAENVVLFKDLG